MFDADAAELFVAGFAGVNDAVAEECEYVPGLGLDGDLVVSDGFKHDEGQSAGFDHVRVAVAAEDGTGDAGVGNPQGLEFETPTPARENRTLGAEAWLPG